MQAKKVFYFFMIFAMFALALAFANAKYLSAYINEYELTSYRYFIAILTTAPLLSFLKIGYKIDIKNLAIAVLVGILLSIYNALFFIGTSIGDISLGGVIITIFMPFIAFIIMLLFNKKKPNINEWMVISIGAIGVLIMVEFWLFDLEKIFTKAMILFLSASSVWAVMFVMTSKTKNIHPIIFSFYSYIACTVLTFLIFQEQINVNVFDMDLFFWFNLLFISLFSTTFATTMYFFSVQRLGNNSVVFTFLIPFFTIILGIILFNEKLKISTLIGVIIIIIAIIIMNNVKIKDLFQGFKK